MESDPRNPTDRVNPRFGSIVSSEHGLASSDRLQEATSVERSQDAARLRLHARERNGSYTMGISNTLPHSSCLIPSGAKLDRPREEGGGHLGYLHFALSCQRQSQCAPSMAHLARLYVLALR